MTPKQARFVAEYLIDLNATQAAIRAGYAPKTANRAGSDLLTKPDIQAAVSSAKDRQLKSADLSATRILEEMRRVALVDPGAIFNDDGRLKAVSEWDEDTRRAISSVDVKRLPGGDAAEPQEIVKVRFVSKTAALDQLGKHFGLLKEQIEISGSQDLIDRLTAARRRVNGGDE